MLHLLGYVSYYISGDKDGGIAFGKVSSTFILIKVFDPNAKCLQSTLNKKPPFENRRPATGDIQLIKLYYCSVLAESQNCSNKWSRAYSDHSFDDQLY